MTLEDATGDGSTTHRPSAVRPMELLAISNNTKESSEKKKSVEEEDEEDRDDKSWRTRGESSPSALSSPLQSLAELYRARVPHCKRESFWRNVVRQFNFTDPEERALVLSLTQGIDWMHMSVLPPTFMARHREIYYMISTADYERSSTIQRDVTRTFSIFERSQLPTRERDVNAQQRALFRVLNALAEAEDGYCQGMNFVAALFLVEGLGEADAYALFLYLLKKRHLARIYQRSSTFLDDYLLNFELMLQAELPELYHHMQVTGFAIPMYGIEWFTTLFTLSTKPDLACAIFDLFFVGVRDIFLRVGIALLKLLEPTLLCMNFEDFIRDFKPLVRQVDPYQAIFQALAIAPNPHVTTGEDTSAYVARQHYIHAANLAKSGSPGVSPPRAFQLHRSLPPELASAIERGDLDEVSSSWELLSTRRPTRVHARILANEILHFAIWFGQPAIAMFAIKQCEADVNDADDAALTPLHFGVIRNEPDLVRLLLCYGADATARGGKWSGASHGLTPLKTARHWKFNDTTAARLVLGHEICVYCNTKFDAFALYKEVCKSCHLPFCGRGRVPTCIERHQCPADMEKLSRKRWPRHGYDFVDTSETGSDTLELIVCRVKDVRPEETCDGSSSSSSSGSRRSSHCMSETSSFVYITSPVNDLPADLSPEGLPTTTTTSTKHDGTQPPPSLELNKNVGLLSSLVNWFSGLTSTAPDSSNHSCDPRERPSYRGIEFPEHPEWYCNAPQCHVVFAFFSSGDECEDCGGFFCARDFDSQMKRCVGCLERDASPSTNR